MNENFPNTEFVVRATRTEQSYLYHSLSENDSWVHDLIGYAVTVGHIGGREQEKRPVTISCFWANINGMLVLFWEATSQVVDYTMIDTWFKTHCFPYNKITNKPARCEAGEFHHCLEYSRAVSPQEEPDNIIPFPSV